MSYSNIFHDYLRDIPMEIGRRFYPPPLVNIPALTIPEPLRNVGDQGFFGLWPGWIPNCQRAALLNMADIATYDFVKHKLSDSFNFKDYWVTHALASACAGLSAAVVSLPSDVVKTRMMDQIRHELDAKM